MLEQYCFVLLLSLAAVLLRSALWSRLELRLVFLVSSSIVSRCVFRGVKGRKFKARLC
uniref:Uncharacterized protein n=1 Tax=Physcomitrium patens TaxID=3218 RepID=A0A2K1JL67_PHYPA|nr:hypothetical protein PHYPA_017112 [Physcomitrium patens]